MKFRFIRHIWTEQSFAKCLLHSNFTVEKCIASIDNVHINKYSTFSSKLVKVKQKELGKKYFNKNLRLAKKIYDFSILIYESFLYLFFLTGSHIASENINFVKSNQRCNTIPYGTS